ncbi:Uncharacterised protein [uncultured Clostridium sp.]|nr:Uncharacterised protein [uncultured Clostridium sp.]
MNKEELKTIDVFGKAETPIMHDTRNVDSAARYDTAAKTLLANKSLLAVILKRTVTELSQFNLDAIESYIEGDVQISEKPLYNAEKIVGRGTESKVLGEGSVYFDIAFNVIVPTTKERIKLIINVEAQNDFNPGYDLVTRGIFYCARQISAQLGQEFDTEHYNGMKKVYSIWICFKATGRFSNTITKLSLKPEYIFGNAPIKEKAYDKIGLVMVYLNKEMLSHDNLIDNLNTLFSTDKLPLDSRRQALINMGIKVTKELQKEVSDMMSRADEIMEKGRVEGREEGIFHMISLLKKMNASNKRILIVLKEECKISEEQAQEYLDKYDATHK